MSEIIESFFKAVGEFFGWRKQAEDPETIRLKKINDIDRQLEAEKAKRYANMSIPRTPENENALAYDLGVVTLAIKRLRQERAKLER